MTTSYFVASVLWTVAGLIVGYFFGSAAKCNAANGSSAMWAFVANQRIRALEARVNRLEERWCRHMAEDREALARLDEQIANLRDYIRSDEATDAAEVDRRTEEIRTLLAEAQGSGEAPVEQVAEREREVADVVAEADTGADSGGREAGDVSAPEGQPEQHRNLDIQ